MQIDWSLVAIGAPGYLVTAYAALALVGRAPIRFRKWDRARIESEHEEIVRAQQLARIAPMADALETLVGSTALILAAIAPNGGKSLSDGVLRIEAKLDAHLADSDKITESVYDQLADQGNEIDSVVRRVRTLEETP